MSTTPKTTASEKNETAEAETVKTANKVIPAQVSGSVVESNDGPKNGEVPSRKDKLVKQVKGLAKNKRVLASVLSTVLITTGVVVVRKRNEAAVEEAEAPFES